ncbi:MAG: hypothetical protein KTR31_08740 [Myxococcales bacterium]|nr:hypothetical protein [Myxococcales bacterium]
MLLLLCTPSVGCGGLPCEQTLEPSSDPSSCVPDREAWEATVAPIVQARCGDCHGDLPVFGAPDALVDFDELIRGAFGNRLADRMARRAAMHTMPPPNSPQLDHAELDQLVGWATCGEVHPDPTIGLVVDRQPYTVDVPDNALLPSFDILADGFEVAVDLVDRYFMFVGPR